MKCELRSIFSSLRVYIAVHVIRGILIDRGWHTQSTVAVATTAGATSAGVKYCNVHLARWHLCLRARARRRRDAPNCLESYAAFNYAGQVIVSSRVKATESYIRDEMTTGRPAGR